MGEEDRNHSQVMLSSWWHNNYNSCWFFLDTFRKVLIDADSICFTHEKGCAKVSILKGKKCFIGHGTEVKEAFFEAFDLWNIDE